ncbi:MAG: hypothetical protein ACI4QC_03825 [Thermoguttaceae bacterium]
MRTFKDALGNEWTIKVTLGTARRIRENMANSPTAFSGVDFLDYAGLLLGLEDPFFAADLVELICADEREARGVSRDAFLDALTGDRLFDAIAAFVEEYVNFFPNPATRERLTSIRGKIEEIEQAKFNVFRERIDETAEKIQSLAADASRSTSSTESPTPEAALPTGTTRPSPNFNE